MQLVDTHCHIHDSEFYPDNREHAYGQSIEAGVAMICVGTNVQSSREAIEFCAAHAQTYPVVGIHPHDSETNDPAAIRALVEAHRDQIIGIGEIGLDYFYDNSPRVRQIEVLRAQLAIAVEFDLPVSFHVRDAASIEKQGTVWQDFWPILDEYKGVRGVMHSFTDTQANCDEATRRGLLIGINGISTFTKDANQQQLFANLPLENIVLETDAPFLTPVPFRGKMNLPAYVGRVAEHQASLKGVADDVVARITTANAEKLFGITL